MVSSIEKALPEDRYIVNRRETGQRRKFTCKCCSDVHDFSNSIDYVGAVDQWGELGGMCYPCGNGFCHCQTDGKKFI